MHYIKLSIPDLILVEPKVFGDDRGFFFESFSSDAFSRAVGRNINFVQDNHSKSAKGVLRGLHLQKKPKAQGKLVRVVKGEIFDVAVDLREDSPTFGKWESVVLSADNRRQLWIPEGFAHGFLVLKEDSEVLYKTTDYYSPDDECCLNWNDSEVNINWPRLECAPIVSKKDEIGVSFSEVYKF